MSDFAQRIRERAYQIWQSKGCPEGEAEQNWCQAERELSAGINNDGEMWNAHDYERNLHEFERNGRVRSAAEVAKRAVESPEGESLRQAEEQGKQRSKGGDL